MHGLLSQHVWPAEVVIKFSPNAIVRKMLTTKDLKLDIELHRPCGLIGYYWIKMRENWVAINANPRVKICSILVKILFTLSLWEKNRWGDGCEASSVYLGWTWECVCVCVWGWKLRSERTQVDKSYGHRSGPPHFMPKSVVPLIITDRRPDRATHTASFIHADQFTQQPFCSGLRDM